MKFKVRAAALCACLCLMLCAASCAGGQTEEIPAGTKLASAAGADFRLYVPTTWNLNTDCGISGAYYSLRVQSTVSVSDDPLTDEMKAEMNTAGVTEDSGERIEWFWNNRCYQPVVQTAVGKTAPLVGEDCKAVVLDTVNARQYHYTATVQGTLTHFWQVVGDRGSSFCVLTVTVADELYQNLLPDAEAMLAQFRFAEPYSPAEYAKTPDGKAEAPEGMKIVSGTDVSYRFFVPEDWVIDRDDRIYAAYVKEDGTSVSVVPYLPNTESMSVAEYFAISEKQMKNLAGEENYQLIGSEQVTLGGRTATLYQYSLVLNGTEYRYRQIVAAYRSMIYSVTYTALPEHEQTHLPELDRIISAFAFR